MKVTWTLLYDFVVQLVIISFNSIDIDECVSNACKNDGSCVDGINEYTCNCRVGFMGEQCETGELIKMWPNCRKTLEAV